MKLQRHFSLHVKEYTITIRAFFQSGTNKNNVKIDLLFRHCNSYMSCILATTEVVTFHWLYSSFNQSGPAAVTSGNGIRHVVVVVCPRSPPLQFTEITKTTWHRFLFLFIFQSTVCFATAGDWGKWYLIRDHNHILYHSLLETPLLREDRSEKKRRRKYCRLTESNESTWELCEAEGGFLTHTVETSAPSLSLCPALENLLLIKHPPADLEHTIVNPNLFIAGAGPFFYSRVAVLTNWDEKILVSTAVSQKPD